MLLIDLVSFAQIEMPRQLRWPCSSPTNLDYILAGINQLSPLSWEACATWCGRLQILNLGSRADQVASQNVLIYVP